MTSKGGGGSADELPEAGEASGDSLLPANTATGVAAGPAPTGAATADLDRPTRKRKSRPAKSKGNETKPSHPLSAYNYFFRDERVRFLQEPKRELEPGENRFTSMGKEIARRWKALQGDQAQKYHKMAASDLVRYRKEMEEFQLKKGSAQALKESPSKSVPSRQQQKPPPQPQGELDRRRLASVGLRESAARQGESFPPLFEATSSSLNMSSDSFGHRDVAMESTLNQLIAQDPTVAAALAHRRSLLDGSNHNVPDHSTLGLQLLAQQQLLAGAASRTGADHDYSGAGNLDLTTLLRNTYPQGQSFTEQLLLGNGANRIGAASASLSTAGQLPWNTSSSLALSSLSGDPVLSQQRMLEQYELLQLLSNSALARSADPFGLSSPPLGSNPSSGAAGAGFASSNDVLALQRLLLLRQQQERDLQTALALRNAGDDMLLERLLGGARNNVDSRAATTRGQRSRELYNNDDGRESSGESSA